MLELLVGTLTADLTRQLSGQDRGTQQYDVEVVVVPEQTGRPGDPLADGPLHDGVRAVREGRTVLSDGTVDKPEVLKHHRQTFPTLSDSPISSPGIAAVFCPRPSCPEP